MANIILKNNDEVLLKGVVSDLSPLGVECDMELDGLERLRTECGKFRPLDIEIQIKSHGRNGTVRGSGNVYSVRRISQSRCMVNIRFTAMEQNSLNLISGRKDHKDVISLTDVRQSRSA